MVTGTDAPTPQLKTLSKQDPEFDSYLRGTFSKTRRALPVRSLNVDSGIETVTFQILPLSQIPRPPALQLWAQVFRLKNFVSVLFPLFLIVQKDLLDEIPWDPLLAAFSALGALSLSVGAFLLNDYLDHVKGIDRVHPASGSRAIQNGWVTAESTRRWSWFYLILGALLGVPAVVTFPAILWCVAVPALAALVSWSFPKTGLKYRRFAEFVVFLLFGPFLTVGFQLAITGRFDIEALWIGVLTGWHFTFLVHLKNFESIIVNSQAGFRNTIGDLGFERAKVFLQFWWVGFLVCLMAYQAVYYSLPWLVIFAVFSAVLSWRFLTSLRQLKSPAGSKMKDFIKVGRSGAFLILLIWALQALWYGLVVELVSPS